MGSNVARREEGMGRRGESDGKPQEMEHTTQAKTFLRSASQEYSFLERWDERREGDGQKRESETRRDREDEDEDEEGDKEMGGLKKRIRG